MEGNIKRKRDGNKARIGPEHQSNGGNDCGGIIMSALLANKKKQPNNKRTLATTSTSVKWDFIRFRLTGNDFITFM